MALTKVIGNGLGATQEGAITFNEGSADVDFRVESNGNTHMLFVQAGSDCLGIKTASPNDYYADDLVLTAPDEGGMTIVQGTGHRGYLAFADGTSGSAAYRGYISYDHADDKLYLGTDGGGKLLIDTTGAVTMPSQPAFLAKLSTAQNNIVPTTIANVVQFDTEIFDQNADFDTSNYRFVAPVTGRYQINVHLYLEYLDTGATYYYLEIDSSNRDIYHIIDIDKFSADLDSMSFTMSQLIDMDASDTVRIRIVQQGGTQQTDINAGSFFSGYLVA